jgi:hypothetical protein
MSNNEVDGKVGLVGARLQKRQAVIDKYFPPNESSVGRHKFNAKSGRCEQCNAKFLDWLEGKIIRNRLCNVIGRDEVARFHNPMTDIIRGDGGGY